MNDVERILFHIAVETEGEISPAQLEGPPLTDEQIREVERLCAADKVMRMRRVRQLAQTWHESTRARYALAFEALSKEFADAAAFLNRMRADEEIPMFLRRQAE